MAVFLTLVSSIGLRMMPPDQTLSTITSVCLFAVPIVAIFMETPLYAELNGGVRMLVSCCARMVPFKRMVGVKSRSAGGSNAVAPQPNMESTTEPATRVTPIREM